MNRAIPNRLAVCSWSLQPQNPKQLAEQMRQIGLNHLQIALDPIRENPDAWGHLGDFARNAGWQFVSGMFGCVGEDYTTMETIRQTGGIVPNHTWQENWDRIQKIAPLAKSLGLKLVTFHAGFLPHDEIDAASDRASAGGVKRRTYRAGGLEGGITNGEPIVAKVAMKPISTLMSPLSTIEMTTRESASAVAERSDVTAVPAMGVIAEAMMAFVIADAFMEKFGGDSMTETKRNYNGYIDYLGKRRDR